MLMQQSLTNIANQYAIVWLLWFEEHYSMSDDGWLHRYVSVSMLYVRASIKTQPSTS